MAIFDKNDKKEILKVRRAVLRKFPALATTMSTLKFKATRKVETAATDGEKVYYNPDFMGRLKFDEKVFVMAHETMHVSHNHLVRAGKKKDLGSWNTATDAVINQTLVDEGLPIPQVEGMNFVDIQDAKDKSAEQMYKKLRTQKRRDQQQQAQQQGGQSKQGNQSGSPQQSQPEQSQPQQSGQGQSSQSSGQQPQNSGSSGGQPQQSTGAGTQSQPSGQSQTGRSNSPQSSQTGQGGGQTEDRTQEGGSSGGDGETQDKTSQGQGGSGQKQQKQPEQTQSEGSGETKPKKDYEQKGHSDHDMWKKAIEKAKKQQEKDKKDKSSLKPDEKKTDDKKPQEKPQTDKPKGQPQEQPKADKPQKPKQSEESGGEESEGEKVTEDDYSAEEDSFKESHREKVKKDTDTEGEEKEDDDEEGSEDDLREKEFRELNKKLRKELVEKMKQAIERKADGAKDRTFGRGAGQEKGKFGQVGDAKAVVSWRTILRREFDKDQPEWSYRRSSEENYYMARIENRIMFEQPMTEVMLDTSGSIDDVLLRGFLRQLKPLLKSSKMKVACFDDDVYGFVEIKTNEDIDSFTFYGRGGTNLDAPVRAFSKDRKVNKIIFTDGCGYMPREDLKDVNVIWLIFDNDDFHPCCGKVIYVNKAEVIKEEDDYENESDI